MARTTKINGKSFRRAWVDDVKVGDVIVHHSARKRSPVGKPHKMVGDCQCACGWQFGELWVEVRNG